MRGKKRTKGQNHSKSAIAGTDTGTNDSANLLILHARQSKKTPCGPQKFAISRLEMEGVKGGFGVEPINKCST